MWFSPGMIIAAILVLVLNNHGVSFTTWWVWLIAVIVCIAVDMALGISAHNVPKVKTERRYYKDTEE